MPNGTPSKAPISHADTVPDVAEARLSAGNPSRSKLRRKDGKTRMPPMKPTEYPNNAAVKHAIRAAK